MHFLTEGLRPSDSPTRGLARRCDGSLRPRGSLARSLAAHANRDTRYTVPVSDFVFFYGTLMAGFDRRRRAGMDDKLKFQGRGWMSASLFDLGLYPAAVPSPDGCVWGELYEMAESTTVLAALDGIEGYTPGDPDHSLYVRSQVTVTLPDAVQHPAWVYFYNAPLGQAPRIESGDYLQHVRVR